MRITTPTSESMRTGTAHALALRCKMQIEISFTVISVEFVE